MATAPTTDALVVAVHWLAAGAVLLSAATGLRIAADHPDAVIAPWLDPILLQGGVHQLHALSGLLLMAVATAYVAYLRHARQTARLRVPKAQPTGGVRRSWRARNVRLYHLLFLLIVGLGVSGTLLYVDWVPPAWLPVAWLTTFHELLVWAVLATSILHVLAQYKLGAATGRGRRERARHGLKWLLKMLRPRLEPGWRRLRLQASPITVLVSLATALLAGGGLFTLDRELHAGLEIAAVDRAGAPILDGRGDDPVWREAETATVLTRDGANLPGGQSRVEIQAASDGREIFLKFRWEDPTRSLKHLPLRKTANGWRLLHEAYDIEDEDLFYEDKFAVLLATEADIAGGVTHLGPKPLADKPGGLSGRGLHYTTDGSIHDMWQWKSVRSQPMGKLDDDLFGPPAEPKPAELAGTMRYKGGYVTDPGKIGSANNFAHEGPGGYQGDVRPTRLPLDLGALQARLAPMNLDVTASDTAPWIMTEAESAPYSSELDAALPVGTVIPGVILKTGGSVEGDRGHVRTGAAWENGHWTLEVARALDTGSAKDVAFRPGESVYLWVSVFDRSQTRHSRHVRPIELRLPGAEA